jgi:hypothetical protein
VHGCQQRATCRAGAAGPGGRAMAMQEQEIDFEVPVHESGDYRGSLTICGNHDRTNLIQHSKTSRVEDISFTVHDEVPPTPRSDRDGAANAAGSPRRLHRPPYWVQSSSSRAPASQGHGSVINCLHASIDAVDAGGARVSTDGCTGRVRVCTDELVRPPEWHAVAQPRKPPGRVCVLALGRLEQLLTAATSKASDGDQTSSAASTHGNNGGSQPRPRHSLGGDSGAETRRRSGEARSRGGAHGVAAQGRGWTVFRLPSTPLSMTAVGLATYGPDFKAKHPDLVVACLALAAWIARRRSSAPAVSPPDSRAAAAAGDSN